MTQVVHNPRAQLESTGHKDIIGCPFSKNKYFEDWKFIKADQSFVKGLFYVVQTFLGRVDIQPEIYKSKST